MLQEKRQYSSGIGGVRGGGGVGGGDDPKDQERRRTRTENVHENKNSEGQIAAFRKRHRLREPSGTLRKKYGEGKKRLQRGHYTGRDQQN